METKKIEVVNERLREEFRKIKLIYIMFLIEPFILFGIMFVVCYFMGDKIKGLLVTATLSQTLPRTISLVFIILSVIEYYSIVAITRRLNKIIGSVKDVIHYSSRYLNIFILLLSIATIPSVFGFVYYLISFDIILSSLFYLISIVSILRVLPRFNDFRNRYIDLSEEDI